METSSLLQCLVDQGFISQAKAEAIEGMAGSLPTNEVELLQLLVGMVVEQPNCLGTVISAEAISSSGSGDVQTITPPDGATNMQVTAIGNNIIYRHDGGTPTTTAGHIISDGNNATLPAVETKFIGDGATVAFITYYR